MSRHCLHACDCQRLLTCACTIFCCFVHGSSLQAILGFRMAGYGVCMSFSICMVMAVSNSYCRLAISGQVLPVCVLCLHANQQAASLQPVWGAGKLICSSDCCLLGLWTVAGSMDCS